MKNKFCVGEAEARERTEDKRKKKEISRKITQGRVVDM